MDISEVAKMSGLPVSTIRYYDEQGLIKSTGRSGLRRQFNNSVVERLAMISLGSSVGFSLLEMKHMLTEQGAEINRELLMAKADELDNQIKKLDHPQIMVVTASPDGKKEVIHLLTSWNKKPVEDYWFFL